MEDFFRKWNTPHFLILYGILFAVQILLFKTGSKRKKDRYWISLSILQILSILLVIYGNYEPPAMFLSFPNNFISAIVAIPVYSIFFFVTLAKRSCIEEMPGTKIWWVLLIISIVAVFFVPATLKVIKLMPL